MGAFSQVCKEKVCRVCSKPFMPTGRKQWRCVDCSKKELRPGPVPKCACGCGTEVRWSRQLKGWREFAHGHSLTALYRDKPKAAAKRMRHSTRMESRKGITVYDLKCLACGKQFENVRAEAVYCSSMCHWAHARGPNSPMWTGGARTKYRSVQVQKGFDDPKMVREHRVIMSAFIGRRLSKTEVIHHIDENGLNNVIENLHLFHCTGCHTYFHKNGEVDLRYVYPELHMRAFHGG